MGTPKKDGSDSPGKLLRSLLRADTMERRAIVAFLENSHPNIVVRSQIILESGDST